MNGLPGGIETKYSLMYVSLYPFLIFFSSLRICTYNDNTHPTYRKIDNCESRLLPVFEPPAFVYMEPHSTTDAISEPTDEERTLYESGG